MRIKIFLLKILFEEECDKDLMHAFTQLSKLAYATHQFMVTLSEIRWALFSKVCIICLRNDYSACRDALQNIWEIFILKIFGTFFLNLHIVAHGQINFFHPVESRNYYRRINWNRRQCQPFQTPSTVGKMTPLSEVISCALFCFPRHIHMPCHL